ncbi:MAG: hypothetical protein J5858_06335 [Lentisphaeria bacterium]|nr:hypothetical protein [Lentisphaeria bacterium]
MNSYQKRAIAAAFVAILLLTALFLIIPKTPLVITGYLFSILGIVAFFGSLVYLAGSTKKNYLVNSAFPFVTRGYSIAAISFSFLMAALGLSGIWSMPVPWFIFVQIIFAAVLIFKLLILGTGKDLIESVGEKVAVNYTNWKLLLADVEAILAKTAAESRKDVTAVRDAVKYADPMSNPALGGLEQEIRDNIAKLSQIVDEKKTADITALCVRIQDQIKDRARRLQILK